MKCAKVDCSENYNWICKSKKKNKGVCWIAVGSDLNIKEKDFSYYLRMYSLTITLVLIAVLILSFSYQRRIESLKIKNEFLKNDIEWYRKENKALILDKQLLSQPLYLEEAIDVVIENGEVMYKYGEELLSEIENLEGLYNAMDEAERDISKLYQRTEIIMEKEE